MHYIATTVENKICSTSIEWWLTQNKTERRPAVWVTEKYPNPHEWINEDSISIQQTYNKTLEDVMNFLHAEKKFPVNS